MFRLPFFRRQQDNITPKIYQQLIKQARQPWFYTIVGVEDTQQGRFEVIVVHMYLALRRLKEHKKLAQNLFDYFFNDLDRSLREMGVGDLSVGKKIKSLLKLFYYRVECYDQNLDNFQKPLEQFFLNRSFHPPMMDSYMKEQMAYLKGLKDTEILSGNLQWKNGDLYAATNNAA